MIVRCKVCGESMEHLTVLEHIAIKHEDKEASELLDQLNRLSGRWT